MRNRTIMMACIFFLLCLQTGSAESIENIESTDQNLGIKRHSDTIIDSNGVLHKVWQEPVNGQYEIFYTYQRSEEEKEMGIGSDKNPTIRITNTPRDSTWPKLSIDSSSNILYILWTEDTLESTTDGHPEDGDTDVMLTTKTLFIIGFVNEPQEQPEMSIPKNLADGRSKVLDFKVTNSQYTLSIENRHNKILQGVIDTDDDGIKDTDEVLGTLGAVTSWLKADTDDDGLMDKLEYIYGFDPLFDDSTGQNAKLFLDTLVNYSDDDLDGLTYKEETEDTFPVTVGVANIGNGGHVTYTFHPWATHSTYVELGLQIRRYGIILNSPPEEAEYSVTVIMNPGTVDEEEITYSDYALEGERFKITVGLFDVYQDTPTNVRIDVSVAQPQEYYYVDEISEKTIFGFRRLAVWSVFFHAPSPNFELFNYKQPANYIEALSDNVYTYVDDFEITGDPNRPDVFLEIDFLEGHEQEQEVWSEVINAFSDAGILLHYKIDDTDISLSSPTDPDDDSDGAETLRNDAEYRDFLNSHKNPGLEKYVHMIFAHYIENDSLPGWTLYGGAFSAATEGDISHSGVVFADQAIQEITDAYSTLIERRTKIIIHEIGHVLCASHEKSTGTYHPLVDGGDGLDDMNLYNVMTQDKLNSSSADKLLRGEDNTADRYLGASELIGYPRFSIEAVDQFDLTNKLSVDTGRNIDLLGNYI